MNGENKISVVINTYNAERDLEQVLEAVKDFDEVLVWLTIKVPSLRAPLPSSRRKTRGCWWWMPTRL